MDTVKSIKEYDAVIFDMDGVIFDSERAVMNCWLELAEKYGIENIEEPYYACTGTTMERTREIMLETYGPDFPYDTYAKEASVRYHEKYDGGRLPMKPGVVELLRYLKGAGKKIALASSGIHSNGFSLIRKVFHIDENPAELYQPCEALGGKTIAQTLLTPTRIYVKSILALLETVDVKGISHITGGGFYENIPRSIPDGLCAKIDKAAVKVLPIFDLIAKTGNIPERDMFNTYNMGVGMTVVVPEAQAQTALAILKEQGEDAYVIGKIVKNEEEKVILA